MLCPILLFSQDIWSDNAFRGALMVAKRSSRALALLLALPSAAFALGLGDIRLLSPLNAPLDAEVELVDVAPDAANTIQAQVARRATFARYGLDWPAYLTGVQMRTVRMPDGRQMLKLKSTEAISEPFITLLVEVSWARGHLVREYTMLLDPPVYTPGQSAAANTAVSAPVTGSGVREGAIARGGQSPAAAAPTPDPSSASAAAPARGASAAGQGRRDAVGNRQQHSRRRRKSSPPPQLDGRHLPGEPARLRKEHERAAHRRNPAHPGGRAGGRRVAERGVGGDSPPVCRVAHRHRRPGRGLGRAAGTAEAGDTFGVAFRGRHPRSPER